MDVSGVDPATIAGAYNFEWVEGSDASLAALADGDAIVREGDGHVGRRRSSSSRRPARRSRATVRGVYKKHGDLDQLLGNVVLSQETFDANFPRPGDMLTLVAGRLDRLGSSGRSRPSPTRSSRPVTSSSPTGRHG